MRPLLALLLAAHVLASTGSLVSAILGAAGRDLPGVSRTLLVRLGSFFALIGAGVSLLDGGTVWILWVAAAAALALQERASRLRDIVGLCLTGGALAGALVMTQQLTGRTDGASVAVAVVLGLAIVVTAVLSLLLSPWSADEPLVQALLAAARKRLVLEAAFAFGVVSLSYLVLRADGTVLPVIALASFAVCHVSLVWVESDTTTLRWSRAASAVVLVLALTLGGAATPGTAEPSEKSANGALEITPTTQEALAPGTNAGAPTLEECAAVPMAQYLGQRDCYAEYFIARGDVVGTEVTLDEVVKLHQDPVLGKTFLPHCHEVLHDVAKDRAKKEGVDALLGSYRITCTGGFAHGVLVAYTAKVGWPSIEAELPTFCAKLTGLVVDAMVAKGKKRPAETGWLQWNCNHMLGHLVYENTRSDMIAGAELCTTWAEGTTEATNCGAGFFMEHFLDVTRQQNGWTRPTSAEQVFAECRKITGRAASWCYSESGISVAMMAGYEYEKSFQICKDYAPAEHQEICYKSLGRIVVVTSGYSPERSIAECVKGEKVETLARDSCLHEVAASLLSESFDSEGAKTACAATVDVARRAACDERRAAFEKQLTGSGAGGGTGPVSS